MFSPNIGLVAGDTGPHLLLRFSHKQGGKKRASPWGRIMENKKQLKKNK
jgi:hypothetical protein